jgi:hypothetical protein
LTPRTVQQHHRITRIVEDGTIEWNDDKLLRGDRRARSDDGHCPTWSIVIDAPAAHIYHAITGVVEFNIFWPTAGGRHYFVDKDTQPYDYTKHAPPPYDNRLDGIPFEVAQKVRGCLRKNSSCMQMGYATMTGVRNRCCWCV